MRWIIAHKPSIGRVIVHTFNNKVAESMVADLRAAGYGADWRPFGFRSLARFKGGRGMTNYMRDEERSV